MKIIYTIHTDGKPQGAAYNRINLLCKGIRENGVVCKLVTFRTFPFTNKLFNRCSTLYTLLRYAIILTLLGPKDLFIIYGENMLLTYIVKMPRRARLIVERNEYSTYLIRENLPANIVDKMKQFENLLAKCDAMIVCSDYLRDYYSRFTNAPIYLIPLVVDVKIFVSKESVPQNYIAYCGDFGGNKDGLPILLESFSRIASSFPNYKLFLIGDTSEDNTMDVLRKRIGQLGMEDRVVFTGRVPHSQMPELLCNASLLVLARPANKQAEGGIPSKLAEYLASGRPTLVTRVGELDKYLKDREDIFFAQPDSIEDFADKINFILSNYALATKVGSNGMESVKQFDYHIQSEILIKYIREHV